MLKITLSVILLVIATSLAVGCSSSSSQSNEPIEAEWITSEVVNDTVLINKNDVTDNKITHFMVRTPAVDMAFMAYELNGDIHVRSNLCPPCRSIGFSLGKDTLVCDTCQTTFKAETGEGISGACVDFPKETVPYEISDGKLVMNGNDLLQAYQDTLEPGLSK